jgi:hypothetical protein
MRRITEIHHWPWFHHEVMGWPRRDKKFVSARHKVRTIPTQRSHDSCSDTAVANTVRYS